MNDNSEPIPQNVLDEIRQYFGYLFDRGYRIRSTQYSKLPIILDRQDFNFIPTWEVMLENQDLYLKMYQGLEGLELSFISKHSKHPKQQNEISIREVVYFLSDGKIVVDFFRFNKFDELDDLVREYIEKIESCFGIEYPKLGRDLKAARKKYSDAVIRASEAKQGKKPIIYALISFTVVVLLVGVFWCVYVALFSAFFSAISLDIYSRGITAVLWVVSFPLALFTVLEVRQLLRRKILKDLQHARSKVYLSSLTADSNASIYM